MKLEVLSNDDKKEIYEVKGLDCGMKLADAMFNATEKTCRVVDEIGNIVYTVQTPKNSFLSLSPEAQQNSLMETAMRIMDLYTGLYSDFTDYMEMLKTFRAWAREYEYEFYDTKEYNDFWLEHTEKVFTIKLKSEFGGED